MAGAAAGAEAGGALAAEAAEGGQLQEEDAEIEGAE